MTWKPTALETEQRLRAFAALEAFGMSRDQAMSSLRQALKGAPRNERASTTFRKKADAAEAAVAAGRRYGVNPPRTNGAS